MTGSPPFAASFHDHGVPRHLRTSGRTSIQKAEIDTPLGYNFLERIVVRDVENAPCAPTAF
jgi:hypothetical protein